MNIATIQDLIDEKIIELVQKGGTFVMDNRQYNLNGVQGQNQNFNFGDNGSINQNIGSEVDINKMFGDLKKFVEDHAEPRDKEMVDKLEESVKEKKWDTAKAIFGLLPKTIQVSAAATTLAKAFNLM